MTRAPQPWSADRLGDPDGPAIAVFIHGGFWRARYAADTTTPLAAVCARLTPAPWVWNIEYPRVGMPGGGWPGTALAVRDAVGAAVAAADGRPVGLIGHSAGGHLALWAAHEHPVAVAVSLAGVCDLEAGAEESIGHGAVLEFLGADPDADLYRAASPIARLPLGVPVVLIHGDADDVVPIEQSREFRSAAVAAGDVCELYELRGGGHFEVIQPDGRAWPILRKRLQALMLGGSDPPP
jgi:acetyl esterase/lipase